MLKPYLTQIYDMIPAEFFVLSNYNVEVKGNLVYYPIYMLMFIKDDAIKMPKIDIGDLSVLEETEKL